MRCSKCPMYHCWSNESDKGESCAIFGDGWDSPFQYEDKEGTTVGCYPIEALSQESSEDVISRQAAIEVEDGK